MGLDVLKEAEILAEKLLRDEIISGVVDEHGNPTNQSRHLTSKHNISVLAGSFIRLKIF